MGLIEVFEGAVVRPAQLGDYVRRDGTAAFTGSQSMGGHRLTNLGAPSAGSDAATKSYADGAVVAGNGLVKTGSTLDVQVDDATLEIASDQVRVKNGGITLAKLAIAPMLSVALMAGHTPSGTPPFDDDFEFVVPFGPAGESCTFAFTRATFRTKAKGTSGTSSVNLQRSTGAGAFSGSNLLASDLSIAFNAANHEVSQTSFAVGSCASGDKLRVRVTGLAANSTGWTVQIEMKRTA